MKIAASDIQFFAQHRAVEKHQMRESLRLEVGSRPAGRPATPPPADKVTLSPQAEKAARGKGVEDDELIADPNLAFIRRFLERLTGQKIRLVAVSDVQPEAPATRPTAAEPSPQTRAEPGAGFSMEYDRRETHYEAEQTTFSAEGVIRTADGREIRFDLRLNMTREFVQEQDVSIRMGDAARKAKDPLVINFDGNAARLTDTKFSFDIEGDGTTEQVSFVGAGSGFLALDRNGDGTINNGTELFGPASGNGFSELAAYDSDSNGWIDESDAVYDKLSILSKNPDGSDPLRSISEAGIGAIHLANAATPFELKDSKNESNGQVRSTGIWLSEDGNVGTIQQIDLTV